MPQFLRFFGLRFSIFSGKLSYAGADIPGFRTPVLRGDVEEVNSQVVKVDNLELRLSSDSGGRILLKCETNIRFQSDVRFPVPDATPRDIADSRIFSFKIWHNTRNSSRRGVFFNSGPYKFLSEDVSIRIDEDDRQVSDLWLEFTNSVPLLDQQELPLKVYINKGSQFRICLDDESQQPKVQWRNTPFTAQNQLGFGPAAPNYDASKVTQKFWDQDEYEILVDHLEQQQSLTFAERPGKEDPQLLLHPFSLGGSAQPVALAALGIECSGLHLKVSRGVGKQVFKVDELTAINEADEPLDTFALVDQGRVGFHQWDAPREIPLVIRPFSKTQPGGLLLKETDDPQGFATQPKGSNEILGFRKDMKLKTVGNKAVIQFSISTPVSLTHPQVNPQIYMQDTTPYLSCPAQSLAINRPGISMSIGKSVPGSGEVDSWLFQPAGGVAGVKMPLVPDECVINDTTLATLLTTCNETYQNFKARNALVTHESLFTQDSLDTDKSIVMDRVFMNDRVPPQGFLRREIGIANTLATRALNADRSRIQSASQRSAGLGAHISQYQFGNYKVTRQWTEGEPPDYVVIDADNATVGNTGQRGISVEAFLMENNTQPNQQTKIKDVDDKGGLMRRNGKPIIAVLKLGKTESLEEVLLAEGVRKSDWDEVQEVIPTRFKSPSWYGLILFDQELNLDDFPLLQSLLPDSKLTLKYLAVTPESGDNGFATYGHVKWVNKQGLSVPDSLQRDQEVNIRMLNLEISWAGRKLSRFYSETLASFRTFAGSGTKKSTQGKAQEDFNNVTIIGGLDQDTGKITFIAQADNPVALLQNKTDEPDSKQGIGPIAQVWVKRIEISRESNKTYFDVDGDVQLQSFVSSLGQTTSLSGWELDGNDVFSFKGLSFGYSGNLPRVGNWLQLDYPSINFKMGKGWTWLDFEGCKIELKRLAFDKTGTDFNWGDLLELPDSSPAGNGPHIRFGLNINLGKLPLLSENPFKEMLLDIEWSIPFNGDSFFLLDFEQAKFGLKALGFTKLNLRLMRFLEISAEKVSFGSRESGVPNIKDLLWLLIQDLKVKILEKTVLKELTFAHFWLKDGGNTEKGFIGVSKQGFNTGILNVHWGLIGRNIELPEELAKSLISLIPQQANAGTKLVESFEKNELWPRTSNAIGEWIFAAGFGIMDDFLLGKFLFQDNAYYGLALEGPIMRKVFGYPFAMSVLYIQKPRPEEDLFRLEVAVPSIDLVGFSFNGGVIAIEIQMNGGFLVDMGYPWIAPNGERMWERGLGVMFAGLMGRGGCFVAKRSSVRQQEIGSKVYTLFEGGQASMVGIGDSFSAGPLRVRAWAGIYYAAEGGILFESSGGLRELKIVGLRLSGAIGIQARGIAELDWWIISVRVQVVAGAEARLTVFWGALENHDPGSQDLPATIGEAPSRLGVRVDFVLYARVSARACIGKSFYKICKSISVGISMPYRTTLYLK